MYEILKYEALPDLVTVSEAARYLGVGRRGVYQLLEYGELRAIRERSRIYIDPCSLREFREGGKML